MTVQNVRCYKPRENSMSLSPTATLTAANSSNTSQSRGAVASQRKPFDVTRAIEDGVTCLMFILLIVAAPIPLFVLAKMLYLELAQLSIYQLLQLI